ncbi:hypothetical protein K7X08_008993 [Anisodus acutangulus]|uniref:Protein kinase domain-containing protein n=1 Tax=Anisodus acutangulus TaxID=402998 RepID=A0A9Q1RT66_9SOLA|nr:hypothetical protein K7X08_008993 [Anisodus acutangulus]
MKNDLLDLSSEDLSLITGQFSPDDLIGLTHLGKLYRGKMPNGSVTMDVAVKILVDDKRIFMANVDDNKLTRLERVKTALALAHLLTYLHGRKYLIRSFSPSHIVVDQKFTPVLFEFGLLVGGVLGNTIDESDMRLGPFGYIDPFSARLGPGEIDYSSFVSSNITLAN